MAAIGSFRDLDVYKIPRENAKKIFLVTRNFPDDEKYSLTNQIRRSSRAVCAMLAEAWARRRYQAAFVNKINEALGEAMETQSWLDHAVDCSYINAKQFQEMDSAWQHVGAMLNRMMERAETFCRALNRKG